MTTGQPDTTHPLLQHLTPLLATQSRRRMTVMAMTALFFSMFTVGVETILPLWVTQELGLGADQWAHLRSLRFAGVFVGVILLGALSDRFGQRLLSVLAMFAAAGVLIGFWLRGGQIIWLVMPVFGALVSTVFVNLNALTQQVSARRQGVANSVYRGIGAGIAIIAPAAVTWLGARWGGYPPVFGVCAALLVLSAFILWHYPGEQTPQALGNLRDETRRLWGCYATAFRQRNLMLFILLSTVWGNVLAGVGAFFAVYFTLPIYLNQQDEQYGRVMSLAGAATFFATMGIGVFLDRVSLRKLHGVAGILAGVCSILMALATSPVAVAACFIAFSLIANPLISPTSMWVSRAAGDGTQTSAFTVQKIVTAFVVAVTMALLGVLEKLIGIRAIMLYGGILGIVTALGFFLLPEPPKPWERTRRAPPKGTPAPGA